MKLKNSYNFIRADAPRPVPRHLGGETLGQRTHGVPHPPLLHTLEQIALKAQLKHLERSVV